MKGPIHLGSKMLPTAPEAELSLLDDKRIFSLSQGDVLLVEDVDTRNICSLGKKPMGTAEQGYHLHQVHTSSITVSLFCKISSLLLLCTLGVKQQATHQQQHNVQNQQIPELPHSF